MKPPNKYPKNRRYRSPYQETFWTSTFFILALTAIFLLLKLPIYFAYMAGINLVTFGYYGFDKWRAKNEGWRVPEYNLHLMAILGGMAGGITGMVAFNHKTRKQNFVVILGSSLAAHVILFMVVFLFFDQPLLQYNDWLAKARAALKI